MDKHSTDTHVIHCWNDGDPIVKDGVKYKIPSPESTCDAPEYEGVFCSLACGKRYILSNYLYNNTVLALFTSMCRKEYKIYDTVIPAPHIAALKKYSLDGTGLTIDEYRNVSNHGVRLIVITPPVFPPISFKPFQFGIAYDSTQDSSMSNSKGSNSHPKWFNHGEGRTCASPVDPLQNQYSVVLSESSVG